MKINGINRTFTFPREIKISERCGRTGGMSLKIDNLSGPALAKLSELAGKVAAARQAAGDPVAEVTAGWVGPQYLLSLSTELAARSDGPDRFKLLRQAAGDVVGFQRGGMWSARVQIEQERLEFQRKKHKDLMEMAKQTASKMAEEKRLDPNRPMSDEELKACVDKVDEIMGLKGVRLVTTHAVGAPSKLQASNIQAAEKLQGETFNI